MTQTKTTGPSKEVRIWKSRVAAEAFFEDDQWQKPGLELWDGLDKSRENFVVVPNKNFEAFSSKGAEPEDRASLTRYLLYPIGLDSECVSGGHVVMNV